MPTKIEWAEESWNPVTGCTPVSEGCENCYAERFAERLAGRAGYPARPYHFNVTLHPERFEQPLKWRKPRRVFVCSMGDLFHPDVQWEFIYDVFLTMYNAGRHKFIVLTKRPGRMKAVIEEHIPHVPNNVWLGVTAENQARADERISVLLETPAAVRFVSIEPMLGPVELHQEYPLTSWLRPDPRLGRFRCIPSSSYVMPNRLDWVIVGGETGPGARPVHPVWVRSVRDQCVAAGVPFFFKQWGEYITAGHEEFGRLPAGKMVYMRSDGYIYPPDKVPTDENADVMSFKRVGRKRAGRLLDGRVWDEYPEIGCQSTKP